MNYSHSRAVDRGRLISPVFQIIIGLDFVARYPARSVSELWFDWGGGGRRRREKLLRSSGSDRVPVEMGLYVRAGMHTGMND